jgi:hypothetical protein
MRIKRKGQTIPFTETLAFRMMLLTLSIILFITAIYGAFASFQAGTTNAMMIYLAFVLLTGYAVFFNMDRMKTARVSPAAMKRMRRR